AVRLIRIRNPLPNIAQHVVQTETVRAPGPDRVSGLGAISIKPGDRIDWPVRRARVSGAGGVLPLGFRRQPHPDRLAEVLGTIPAHALDRQPGTLETAGV